jgi:hypothetical protein
MNTFIFNQPKNNVKPNIVKPSNYVKLETKIETKQISNTPKPNINTPKPKLYKNIKIAPKISMVLNNKSGGCRSCGGNK